MIVKGYSLALVETEPEDADRLWRIYGTTLRKRRDGAFVPRPGAWEMVREIPLRVDGRRLTIPDVELEHTGPGGYHFYTLVHVRPDGREVWHEGDEFTFPPRRPSASARG